MDTLLDTIPAGEFKAKCLGVMEDVHESGRPIIVTKRGIPVVMVVPYEVQQVSKKTIFGVLKGTITIQGNLINPLDEQWDVES